MLSVEDAEIYHRKQIDWFADGGADLVTALTLTYPSEAIGIARAASKAGLPVVVSFTVETDGRLANAQTVSEAVTEVDEATDGSPAYYMLNCAHPTHVTTGVEPGDPALERVVGVRPNASRMSHAELDQATELDSEDLVELGRETAALRELLPSLTVFGGCCGTDARHVAAIAVALN